MQSAPNQKISEATNQEFALDQIFSEAACMESAQDQSILEAIYLESVKDLRVSEPIFPKTVKYQCLSKDTTLEPVPNQKNSKALNPESDQIWEWESDQCISKVDQRILKAACMKSTLGQPSLRASEKF